MSKILLLILYLLSVECYSQKIYEKSAKITFESTNSLVVDGQLYFEVDVRMSDCLSHLEILDIDNYKFKKNLWDRVHDWWWFSVRKKFDFRISKKFTVKINETNYHLREDGPSEQIYLKCDLLTLKSIFGRKNLLKKLQIDLYSSTGKKIYTKIFKIDKIELIEEGEVRPGVEPG